MKQKFFWKSFVSFSLAWSFLIIFISGIVLYIAPSGRVANWTIWTLFGFSKAAWQAIHTIFSYTFVILSVFHLFTLNWKVFWHYFTTKAATGLNKQKELLVSFILIAVVFLGTYFNTQPFKAIVDFGEWSTESWETKDETPPIPHAEILTLRELAGKYIPMSADSILMAIKQNGLNADSVGQTILTISELNHITPAKLYSIISPEQSIDSIKPQSTPSFQGFGRKTIAEISKELGKDVNDVIRILEKNGIKANPEDKLKSVAEIAEMTPLEIMEIIK
ncbi:MAG: DUF4405 domain-containing protein [Prolixibacteraceae bacterium]|nr:DUF4405 domain-containing protein [Prolixibacteraceae bacterium]